ncbi:MAG: hypothetical protein ACOH5I_10610 [Oligoflexus sp.]
MDFASKFVIGIRSVMAALLLVAVTSTFLMERMSQAIKLILDENVYSLEAAQDMMAAVGLASITPLDLYQEQFLNALARSKKNITLPGESTLIDRIENLAPMAFAGEERSRRQILEELATLANMNRDAMIKADEDARFLAIAGGWAIVGLTIIGLLASNRFFHQVQQQAIAPMMEICRGLNDWEQGNRLRRFQSAKSSKDLRRAQQSLNAILDRLS